MTISLRREHMAEVLERAFLLATSDAQLPGVWIRRAEQLSNSPSVAFIAAVGAVLLAKATDQRADAFVIQAREGSPGAFSLRGPARVLGENKHRFGYDIGSTSDRDPINHGTLITTTRWDVALDRIDADHKSFFQVILGWLAEVNRMSSEEALSALAAYIRVRRAVGAGEVVAAIPPETSTVPALNELVDVAKAFTSDDTEDGARGMALVAAAYRAAGFDASVPARNDPRRIDVPVTVEGALHIAVEVKQAPTTAAAALTLAGDARRAGCRRAHLAVLRPGSLVDVDVPAVVRAVEIEQGVVMLITSGVRELLHAVVMVSRVSVEEFCARLPRQYADALREIRVSSSSIETWAVISERWVGAT